MFQQRRNASMGNIKVGSLAGLPTLEDIGYVLEQATKHRGRFAELGWSVPKTGAVFQLTAKIELRGQPIPAWMLYGGQAGNSQLIWGHNSSDLTLIHNLVMLECDRPLDGSNKVSSASIDNMMHTNVSQGGAPSTARPGAPAEPPSGQWLQNLSNTQPHIEHAAEAPPAVAATIAPAAIAELNPSIQNPGDLLDGSLSNIGVADLLHYLTNNRLTGRLAIVSGPNAGEAFFSAGQIKHAATLESKGENALFDMATWTEGDFQFHADQQTAQQSVQCSAAEVIEGCKLIISYFRALIQQGLQPSAYLIRAQQLDIQQFQKALGKASMQLDIDTQYRMYENATGDRSFAEVLRCSPMVRAEWIPLVFNLVQAGVLQISDRPAGQRPGMYLEGEQINISAINSFVQHITQPTGLLAPGAFLYMLQQEYFRHERTGSAFSLAFFSIAQTNMLDGNVTPLEESAWLDAIRRIYRAKRKLDLLGQFDQQNCAILMPETALAGAAVFAHRIIDLMKKPPLQGASESQQLVHSFGIACIPEDARDLETLIAAVRVAKNKSRMMGAPIVLYGDGAQ